MIEELLKIWIARRTRLLNNERVYAAEQDYTRAIVAKAEAKATLDAIEDVVRLNQQYEDEQVTEWLRQHAVAEGRRLAHSLCQQNPSPTSPATPKPKMPPSPSSAT